MAAISSEGIRARDAGRLPLRELVAELGELVDGLLLAGEGCWLEGSLSGRPSMSMLCEGRRERLLSRGVFVAYVSGRRFEFTVRLLSFLAAASLRGMSMGNIPPLGISGDVDKEVRILDSGYLERSEWPPLESGESLSLRLMPVTSGRWARRWRRELLTATTGFYHRRASDTNTSPNTAREKNVAAMVRSRANPVSFVQVRWMVWAHRTVRSSPTLTASGSWARSDGHPPKAAVHSRTFSRMLKRPGMAG